MQSASCTVLCEPSTCCTRWPEAQWNLLNLVNPRLRINLQAWLWSKSYFLSFAIFYERLSNVCFSLEILMFLCFSITLNFHVWSVLTLADLDLYNYVIALTSTTIWLVTKMNNNLTRSLWYFFTVVNWPYNMYLHLTEESKSYHFTWYQENYCLHCRCLS